MSKKATKQRKQKYFNLIVRSPSQSPQAFRRRPIHVLQPERHQLVQTGRAEDKVRTQRSHQGTAGNSRPFQSALR
jgi:hypothetical protein